MKREGDKPSGFLAFLIAVLVSIPMCAGADVLSERSTDEVLENSEFVIQPRPNYQGAFWIVEDRTGKIIGYAPWDAVGRRWTLFTLKGEYRGFLQATLGTTAPPHYQQYLYYGGDNRYKGLYVAALGGRPVARELPEGELGGELQYFARGNIPIDMPDIRIEVAPLKRFPDGVDVSPLTKSTTR